MTREEFKTLVKGMKAVYAQPTFIPDQDAFNVWFELLKDIPYQQAKTHQEPGCGQRTVPCRKKPFNRQRCRI